jgi:hypothetical protein
VITLTGICKQGHIYCNTINYFRSVEDNNKRGDINEGKTHIKQIKDLTLLIEGKPIARAERGQLYFENPDDKGNLFCLYGVKTELIDLTRSTGQKITIEEQFKDFGDSVLLIHNPKKFLNRVKIALKKLSKKYKFSPVSYYDRERYEGNLSPFFKSNLYEYQNEVRFWIQNEVDKPFEFFIGDISDISHKCSINELDKLKVKVLKQQNNNLHI